MDTLLQDLRFALRMLAKSPGTTTIAALALALGIGASTTIFAAFIDLVLQPFPFPRIDRVVSLYEHHPQRGLDRNEVAPADYLDWKAQTRSFERLAAYLWWDCNLSGAGAAERLQGQQVGPEFFA